MKATPLLFKAEMIQALLREVKGPGTGKTQTRRTKGLEYINEDPDNAIFEGFSDSLGAIFKFANPIQVNPQTKLTRKFVEYPYGKPGDLIWCRESTEEDDYSNDIVTLSRYCADNEPVLYFGCEDSEYDGSWAHWDYARRVRPSIHMHKWASRITDYITDVRVERLQDISEEDAKAEGAIMATWDGECFYQDDIHGSHKCGFAVLWAHINGADSWDRNDWVFVYSFKPILANVDAVIANPEKYGITKC